MEFLTRKMRLETVERQLRGMTTLLEGHYHTLSKAVERIAELEKRVKSLEADKVVDRDLWSRHFKPE